LKGSQRPPCLSGTWCPASGSPWKAFLDAILASVPRA
jgi:hypothetical protein